jgi:hypothetical protein
MKAKEASNIALKALILVVIAAVMVVAFIFNLK